MEQIHKITQAYNQTPWRKQVRMIGIFLLALVVVATVASLYLNVRARAVAMGRELQWMQVTIKDYYSITGEVEADQQTAAEQATAQASGQEEKPDEAEDEIISIEELERNISLLRTQLAYLTSYKVMADRARDLGLVPAEPEDIIYQAIPGYVEPTAVVLAPSPQPMVVTASGIDPAFRQSLFDWVGDQIQQTLKFLNGEKP
jgi:hypothetical protein